MLNTNINKYSSLLIYTLFVCVLQSCLGSVTSQDITEGENHVMQSPCEFSEANVLNHQEIAQDDNLNEAELQISSDQGTNAIPQGTFTTKDGHQVRFSVSSDIKSTGISAFVEYNLTPGFSFSKLLPIVTARDQNVWSILQELTPENSNQLLHLTKDKNTAFLFVGTQGLKGGMFFGCSPVYTADDSDCEDSQPSSYETTLKDTHWPVRFYKTGGVWEAHVRYPNRIDSDARHYVCCNSDVVPLTHDHNETISLSTNGLRAANWTINYSYRSKTVTSINKAELHSSPYEIRQAKDARRRERQNRRDERRRQEIAAERVRIERKRQELEAEEERLKKEKEFMDKWLDGVKDSVDEKKAEKERKERELNNLKSYKNKKGENEEDDDGWNVIDSDGEDRNDKKQSLEAEIEAISEQLKEKIKDIEKQQEKIKEKGKEIEECRKEIIKKGEKIEEHMKQENALKSSIETNNDKIQEIREELDGFRKAFEKEVEEYNARHGSK